ncbi:T9SS type A sorting domain-containing protein [uncultured Polaribacter sp.]|uniref:T9SS type A sorting domain-containing protein n=1 Tax=uncultured Polaribacter sp. TaxID=174711 RepID=UPI00262B8890|nr:T9SS type A sorting domain-containing protein [uncultured Polaribacter sp.]
MKNIYYCSFLLIFLLASKVTSQTLDATLLELKFSNDGYPEKMTKVQNGFYFSSEDDQLWFSDGTIENTVLIKDFDSGLYDDISSLTPVGTKVFFVAENGSDNRELWVSDGTEVGTIQLTDRNVGFSTESIYDIIEFNDKIYFGAYSEVYGFELWVSDGTPAGTFVLKDIAGTDNSSNPSDFFVFNDKLFFKAYTEEFGKELWVSDGTSDGTILFKDINVGPNSGSNSQGYITFNQNFYFFADNGTTGSELWKSDGTPGGTLLLKDIRAGNLSSYNELKGSVLNDKLIFVANDGINGNEIWETNGTLEGTTLFKDINIGAGSGISYDGRLNLVGDKIFFNATNGSNESGLWVTDGTSQNTFFLNEAAPNLLSGNSTGTFAIYFVNDVLWKSDGTINGTTILSEDIQVTNISVSDQSYLAYGNSIFFNGENKENGNELWITDGTIEGTKLFFDVNHSYGVNASLLTSVGNRLFFRGNQYGSYTLCTSDGTIEGTKYLNVSEDGLYINEESQFLDFNGKLIFSGSANNKGSELWISDGTESGTYMIKDIFDGNSSSMNDYQEFSVIQDRIYFSANDGIHGQEFWTSDGTQSGTYMVKDLMSGGSYPLDFVELDNLIYFHAISNSGDALWKSDGTEAGTEIVKNINDIRHLRVVNNKLVIVAETSGTSYGPHDLWVSDGTTAGTNHLMSFGDNIDSDIQFMTILNDELYFVAKEPSPYYKAVYKTDGTLSGTQLLFSDRNHPFINLDIDNIITCGNYVYFGVQKEASSDKELWRTDGTQQGTIPIVSDVGGVFNSISGLSCFKENILFKQYVQPDKLWLSTGQVDEIYDLDINIINGSSNLSSFYYFTSVNDKIFFQGTTNESGGEVYVASLDLSTLGVDKIDTVNEVNNIRVMVYPNPSSNGQLNIKLSDYNSISGFDIYDLSGKKIISKSNLSLSEEMIINLEGLSSGLYILNVSVFGKGKLATKFLVE